MRLPKHARIDLSARARALRPVLGAGPGDPSACRGAALLLAFLVLIVMIAIMYQIQSVTQIDARVSRQEIMRARMDEAIRSTLMQVYEDLAEDARAALAAAGEGGAAGAGGVGGEAGAGAAAGGAPAGGSTGDPGDLPRNPETVDSQMDTWYPPQSTAFDDIQIRVLVRDETSKYNVLNMLSTDEEAAEEALATVARILDNAREGTGLDISAGEADQMARAMLEYMRDRRDDTLGKPRLLTRDDEIDNLVIPLTFREFMALDVFRDEHFQDFYGEDEERIHSIDSFLTIFTSPAIGPEVGGAGAPASESGDKVNVNTAPLAVLSGLFDSRDINYRVWDDILAYRNEDEDPVPGEPGELAEEPDPILDEFGNELAPKRIFDSLDELEELRSFADLSADDKTRVRAKLAVESDVFEIILAARVALSNDGDRAQFDSRREQEMYFRSGTHLVRVVRAVIWRRESGDDIEIVPLVPFEVLENAPLQILDFPDDN